MVTIVSGGQTGADRAALDWAIQNGHPHAGHCPAGRRAENGTIPLKYKLHETDSMSYAHRTRLNIEQSDATLIVVQTAVYQVERSSLWNTLARLKNLTSSLLLKTSLKHHYF